MKSDGWWKELYDANYDALHRLASFRLRSGGESTADAQDIVQEAFLIAVEKDIRSHPNPVGWLMSTVNNLCRNYLRSERRMYRREQNQFQQQLSGNRAARSVPIVPVQEDETACIDIRTSIGQILSPKEWRLLERYSEEGENARELSLEMGISEEAVRVRVCRIRKKVKKKWN